jgi:hypothetical protein
MREKNYIPEVCHSLLVSRLLRRFYIQEESINGTDHSTSRNTYVMQAHSSRVLCNDAVNC